ncbi:MAG TPA: RdgB/HAM1 family non-canonical purine NTP pyrophosphatase [Frankiaceae bacterium]|nr:RdgB/HAM1 family non-canonical purine NTP pyrophosphatase [Frankiaceae bacterium]
MSEPRVRIVLASRNEGKLAELRRILGPHYELVGLPESAPDVAETGATFEENALLKAHAAVAETGLISVADDSGLTVDELNGMPGVLSARWSGLPAGDPTRDDANLRLVLAQLSEAPAERRGAAFVCAAAVAFPDGREHVLRGEVRGRLLRAPQGSGGFGYDPIFIPDGETRTTAEMSPAEKDAISHRGRAFRALSVKLPELLGG